MRPSTEQRTATQQIDAPRHAVRQAVNLPQAILIKRQSTMMPRNGEPVADVLRGFRLAQRIEVEARNHALRQLGKLRLLQHSAQLGLADQHNLQQLAFIGF